MKRQLKQKRVRWDQYSILILITSQYICLTVLDDRFLLPCVYSNVRTGLLALKLNRLTQTQYAIKTSSFKLVLDVFGKTEESEDDHSSHFSYLFTEIMINLSELKSSPG